MCNLSFYCFKQVRTNLTRDLVLIWFIAGARLLLNAAGGLILSSDNPFDFHTEISSTLPFFKYQTKTKNNFACHHLQDDFYHENNLNQLLEVSLLYLALLLIRLLLLILLSSYLNQSYL